MILDGGVETEVQRLSGRDPDPALWGTWALYQAPETVLDVHRGHLAAGCNVLSTATWSILSAPEAEQRRAARPGRSEPLDRRRAPRHPARPQGDDRGGSRAATCAVAFAISEEVNSPRRRETIELLARMFADDPPDMLLLETLTLIREPQTFEMVELLLETGLPVWLSYRRCRHGVCGVYGQHWGPPEGDLFGRAARRFEEMGVEALLINCLPVDHVPGIVSWLRDFTELPLGVYPNLGHLSGPRWRFDDTIGPEAYAELARGWRDEGAQIIGGCCGVTSRPHRGARARARRDQARSPAPADRGSAAHGRVAAAPQHPRALDRRPRHRPLPAAAAGALARSRACSCRRTGSFLVWKHLFRTRGRRGMRCLDVGCGCGIQTVQLALNGATHVHAIDIDRNAIANTVSNAYRNGVGDRVSGDDVDLYQWTTGRALRPDRREPLPDARRSLRGAERPPPARLLGPQPARPLPRAAAAPAQRRRVARSIMQLSIVGQAATSQKLGARRAERRASSTSRSSRSARSSAANKPQIERVEQLSDAYHLKLGGDDVMVAYLIEVSRAADAPLSDDGV